MEDLFACIPFWRIMFKVYCLRGVYRVYLDGDHHVAGGDDQEGDHELDEEHKSPLEKQICSK